MSNISNQTLLKNNIFYTEKDGTQTRNFHTTIDPKNVDPEKIPDISKMNDPVAITLKALGAASATVSENAVEGAKDTLTSGATALATAQAFQEAMDNGTLDINDPSTYQHLFSPEYLANVENALALSDAIMNDPASAAQALGEHAYAKIVEAEGEERIYNILVVIGTLVTPGGNSAGKAVDALGDAAKQAAKNLDNVADAIPKLTKNEINSIINGHALKKHLSEFNDIGINDVKQLESHAAKIIEHPSDFKELQRGRKAYWDDSTGTIVIYDPNSKDKGTIFIPKDGKNYFDTQIK